MGTFLDTRLKLDFTPEQDVASVKPHLQEEAEVMLDEDVARCVQQSQGDPHPS